MAMVFGGSIRFSTAAFRSGEYPTSSTYPAHLKNKGKVERRTTTLTQGGISARTSTAPPASSRQIRATLALIARRSQTAPVSMQTHARKTWNAGQAKPATAKPPDPSGSTPKPKSAPLKSAPPHEIGGYLI